MLRRSADKKLGVTGLAVLALALALSASSAHALTVTTTPASPVSISADNFATYTTYSVTIAENGTDKGAFNDTGGANRTIILTCPGGFEFNTGATLTATGAAANKDIKSASAVVTSASVITITISVQGTNSVDQLGVSGIQIRATAGTPLASGSVYRDTNNAGTAVVTGITTTTNTNGAGGSAFGTFNVVAGAINKLITTLPGETFTAGTGNSGTANAQDAGTAFNLTLTAVDQFFNIVTTYTGAKTIAYSGPTGGPTYTTNVTFTNGQATNVSTTLLRAETTTITASDSSVPVSGPASSSLTVNAGAFSRLQILVPGEVAAPGTLTGKTAALPSNQVVGGSFSITVNSVDTYFNPLTSTDSIDVTSTDATFTDNATSLTGGTATVTGTFNAAGTWTITVSDTTNGAILSDTTPNITAANANATKLAIVDVNGGNNPQAGVGFSVTVQAQDNGNLPAVVVADTTVTLVLKTGTGTLGGTISGTILSGQSNVVISGVTYTKAESGVVLTASVTAGPGLTPGDSAAFTVDPGPAASIAVSAPGTATAGSAFDVTITVSDAQGNIATNYTGTVALTSSDGSATLPGNYTFTGADNGTKTFTGGVTLRTAGSQTVTATDTVVSSVTGNASVTVSPAAAATLSVNAPANATAGAAFSVTVTAQDSFGNTATGYAGTVHFTSGDANATLPSDSTLTNGVGTFTNAFTLGTAGNQTITATDTVTASITGNDTVNVAPGNATSFTVSGPGTATAGTSFNATVTAKDAFGNTATGYAGTVQFSSGDAQATVPSNSTLTNGTGTFSFTLRTAGSQSISATDSVVGTITGTTNVTVSPTAATTLTVTAPANATVGSAVNVTVTAKDQFGNTATGYLGTIAFTSSDTGATLASNYTFQASDNGVKTVTGAVTFATSGSQSVTATDTVTSSITGTANITVSTGTVASLEVNAPATATAGTAINVTVTAKDQFNNTVPTYTGTVHFVSADGQAVLPADYTYVGGDNGAHVFSVTLRTAGSQSITVTDTVTSSITGNDTVAVSAAAATTLVVDAPASSTAGDTLNVTVTAQDAFGNTDTNYTGTIAFTSSDAQATLPSDYTFVSGDNGVKTFNAGVTLKTSGNRTVVATDTNTASITGTDTVAVSAAAAAALVVTGPGNATSGTGFSVTVAAVDAFDNIATGYTGTVNLTSDDAAAASLGSHAYVTGDQGTFTFTNVTLITVQTTTITADDGTLSNTASVVVSVGPPSAATTTVSANPTSAQSGDTVTITVQVKDAGGNNITTGGAAVTLNSTSGNLTNVIDNGDGTYTATLTVTTAGTVTVTGTLNTVALTLNATINVTPGAAAKIAFTTQPSDEEAGVAIAPAVVVTVQDANGNTVNSSASITVAIGNNAGNGTLSGTLTVDASSGVATFADLSIEKAGVGYTLTASTTGLTGDTSSAFTITDTTAPVISGGIVPGTTTGTQGQEATFTVSSGEPGLTYTFSFGDGTADVTNTTGTATHTFAGPGTFVVTVTATDVNGVSTTVTLSYVVAAANTSNDICFGLNPIAYTTLAVGAKLKFPGTLLKDSVSLKAVVNLNNGFNPLGQEVKWDIAGIRSQVTLDEKGNAPKSTTVKVSIRYKKPKKGEAFTARPGKLAISMKGQDLSALKLANVTTLNADTPKTGTASTAHVCVVLTGHQAYETDKAGIYKAKAGKTGAYKSNK